MTNKENQTSSWNSFWATGTVAEKSRLSWSKKRIIEILKPLFGNGSSVLDAGCGSGFFSNYFAENGAEVVAIDNSETALATCKAICGNKVDCQNIDLLAPDLPDYLQNRFDLIFTDGLLEHFTLKAQKDILFNFNAMLKSSGKIVTFVPNRFSPWQVIRPFFMPGIYEMPFTLKRLCNLHSLCNLKIEASGGMNVLPMGLSPEGLLGPYLGMLLYVIASKEEQ